MESGVKYEGADLRVAGVYLPMVMSKERQTREGLGRLGVREEGDPQCSLRSCQALFQEF